MLLIRDADCMRPDTFSVASFMASGVGYCLPTTILASVYKGLNEISRSLHLGRGGAYFSAHFLYAWLANNLDAYKLAGEASSSPGMVKFSGIGRAKSKRSDLLDTNTSKDEGKLRSKPKLKIVRSGKPLEPFVPWMEDGSSHVKIPRIDVVIPATPILAIPIQSDELPIEVCELSTEKATKLPPEGESDDMDFKEELAHVPLPSGSQYFPLIGRIPSFSKALFDSRLRLVNSRGVCSLKDDEAESIGRVNAPSLVRCPQCPLRAPQRRISIFNVDAVLKEVDKNAARVFGKAILDKVSHTPFDGLPSLKGDFNSLYATILQKGVDVTPLESKVQGKLDEASHRLNTEGVHYEANTAELKQVELRRKELLKELQPLED
ncbi:hypothetical protein Cgig2_013177 [Carnegiea gigantea]|uniref:Uncharacterized protein n=1 Tax=Carnegiea gigantea TaxID=171969 RepID=A0A9Q1GWW4_9CARY|nr:hypothetical protein Cgig2_013177 [Carnegiea gigantea]